MLPDPAQVRVDSNLSETGGRPVNSGMPCQPGGRLGGALRLRTAAGRRLGSCGVGEGELLVGDGVTQGIVRIGDTVRRPLRPFSLTVHAYLAHPTTRLYDIANALWYWAPLRDPRDRSPAFADADIPHRVAVFADAYGMTARHRAELAPFAVDMARRYHEDSRTSAELDPVFRRLWEDGAKDELPRAEAWLRKVAPAITARLSQPT